MNTYPERFLNAIEALYDGFFNDTLSKGNCYSCAIGNIVAKAFGYNIYHNNNDMLVWDRNKMPYWADVFTTHDGVQLFMSAKTKKIKRGKKQIKKTGYKVRQLAKLEYAFETASKSENEIENLHNGLMAVVPVLCEIEGIGESKFWCDFFTYDIIYNKAVAVKKLA